MTMTEPVTEYIAKIAQKWQIEVVTHLREIIHEAIPDVQERIQYGKPHFLKDGKYAAMISTAKAWVTFTIFNATALEAEEGFFEPGDPERKTVKIREGQAVDYERLATFLHQVVDSP